MIQDTNDYTIFKKHPNNRELDPGNLRKIINSLKYKNLMSVNPILVNKDMQVMDGQHRLEACIQLKIPVFYKIVDSLCKEDIFLLNENQKKWTTSDFVNFYATQGDKKFILINELSKQYKITSINVLSIFGCPLGGSFYLEIRKGKISAEKLDLQIFISNLSKLEEIRSVLRSKSIKKRAWIEGQVFCRAICYCLSHHDFDFKRFLTKLESKFDCLYSCSSAENYIKIIQDIYNFRSSHHIDLFKETQLQVSQNTQPN